MSAEKNISELPANKPSAELTDKGEEATPQEATPQENTPQEATPKEATPQEATPKEAASQEQEVTSTEGTSQETTSKEATSQQATSQEATSERAERTALQEAVRLLYDEPYTAPSSPEPTPPQQQLIRYPTCRLEVTQDGIVLIENDEEPPQRPDVVVVDDTSSPQHKIARLDDPNN